MKSCLSPAPKPPRDRRLCTASLGVLAGVLLLAGCAEMRLRETASTQLRSGDYESAVSTLKGGIESYPESTVLRSALVQGRLEAMARLLAEASVARAAGRYDDAEKLLRRARPFDAGGSRVDELLAELLVERRQQAALAEAEKLLAEKKTEEALRVIGFALKDNPRHPELVALQRKLELDRRSAQSRATRQSLAENRPISLDFRDAALRSVLDVVSRSSGVNFVFDKDIRPDVRVTVYLKSARVEDALDLITGTYQLAKKVIDERTILIYPNTPEKQREHQEQVVKVFHLVSSDAKGAAAFLKSMLKIRDPYVDERSNLLALRESPENIVLAERLVAVYDAFEPEVLLELEVMEVSSTRLTELGIQFPKSVSLTPLPPLGQTRLTLGNLRGLNRDRIGVGVDDVVLNLRREVGDFNTLANPRIRVKSKEKAKVLIGDKVPIITSTTGQTGFVSDSVAYVDVGLKLDVEPTVFADDDVTIKVGLEVSTLGSQIKTNSGTVAYQISTRNASTVLRLRDGETQLLAGLISSEEKSNASRVPGLGDLPVAGRLFSSQLDNANRNELVLSITPRVLRNVRVGSSVETEFWVGTETQPRFKPNGPMPPSAAPARGAPALTAAGTAIPADGKVAEAAGAKAATSTPPVLAWSGPADVKVGEVFEVTLNLRSGIPMRGLPTQIGFPKGSFEVVDVVEGGFFKQDGSVTSFSKSVAADAGRVHAGAIRNSPNGASGAGAVVTLRLKALQAGVPELTVESASPIGAGDAQASVARPAPWPVQVK